MYIASRSYSRGILTFTGICMLLLGSSAAHADGPYLAMSGQNKTIELLRLSDFTKVAAIDVSPMQTAWITYLPRTRHLYALDSDNGGGHNAVLDFGTCASALLRPLNISSPFQLTANGDETKVLLSSSPGLHGVQNPVNSLVVIDPASDTITATLFTGSGPSPTRIAFDAEGNEFYVEITGGARIFDASTLNELGECPGTAVDIGARGKMYATGALEAHMFVTDAVTCSLITTLVLPGHYAASVRTRSGDKIYVLTSMVPTDHGKPNFLSWNAVTVVDTFTDQISSIPLNRELNFGSLALSADESSLYIAMDGSLDTPVDNALGVLDLQTGVLQQYPIDTPPTGYWGLALVDTLGFACGDGVVETACGEQCDPPGSVVDGQVCDPNCTLGCGNGVASGTEQCDDGNSNNNDACKNDCTWNVCGDGVVNRGVEQCDDGALNGSAGDACGTSCTLPPRTASGQVAAGGTLTTDVEGDGATAAGPVETWVTSPLAGTVSIEEGAPDPTSPSGYAFLGYSVHVTVPSSTADNPIVLVFEISSSLLPPGADQSAVEFSKNGVVALDCDGGSTAASPDPCVASRELVGNGNLRVTLRSATASYWGGVAPLHDARVLPRGQIALAIPANKLSMTKKVLVRVRNLDRASAGKKPSTPIQLTVTNVDCPLGLVADVPDFYPRQPFSQDTVALAPRRTGTARLRLVASRFAFPKNNSPRQCTLKLSAAAAVVDNVDPTPTDNTTIVQIKVTTR